MGHDEPYHACLRLVHPNPTQPKDFCTLLARATQVVVVQSLLLELTCGRSKTEVYPVVYKDLKEWKVVVDGWVLTQSGSVLAVGAVPL